MPATAPAYETDAKKIAEGQGIPEPVLQRRIDMLRNQYGEVREYTASNMEILLQFGERIARLFYSEEPVSPEEGERIYNELLDLKTKLPPVSEYARPAPLDPTGTYKSDETRQQLEAILAERVAVFGDGLGRKQIDPIVDENGDTVQELFDLEYTSLCQDLAAELRKPEYAGISDEYKQRLWDLITQERRVHLGGGRRSGRLMLIDRGIAKQIGGEHGEGERLAAAYTPLERNLGIDVRLEGVLKIFVLDGLYTQFQETGQAARFNILPEELQGLFTQHFTTPQARGHNFLIPASREDISFRLRYENGFVERLTNRYGVIPEVFGQHAEELIEQHVQEGYIAHERLRYVRMFNNEKTVRELLAFCERPNPTVVLMAVLLSLEQIATQASKGVEGFGVGDMARRLLDKNGEYMQSLQIPGLERALTLLSQVPHAYPYVQLPDARDPNVTRILEKLQSYSSEEHKLALIMNAILHPNAWSEWTDRINLERFAVKPQDIPLVPNTLHAELRAALKEILLYVCNPNTSQNLCNLNVNFVYDMACALGDEDVLDALDVYARQSRDLLVCRQWLSLLPTQEDLGKTSGFLHHIRTFTLGERSRIYGEFPLQALNVFAGQGREATQQDLRMLADLTGRSLSELTITLEAYREIFPDNESATSSFRGEYWDMYVSLGKIPGAIELLRYMYTNEWSVVSEKSLQAIIEAKSSLPGFAEKLSVLPAILGADFLNQYSESVLLQVILRRPDILDLLASGKEEDIIRGIDGMIEGAMLYAGRVSGESFTYLNFVAGMLRRRASYPLADTMPFVRNNPGAILDMMILAKNWNTGYTEGFLEKHGLVFPEDMLSMQITDGMLPPYLEAIARTLGISVLGGVITGINADPEYVEYFMSHPDERTLITPAERGMISKAHVSYLQAEMLLRAGISMASVITGRGIAPERVVRALETLPGWNDRDITNLFILGAQTFGVRVMFNFLERREVTLHDALFNLQEIIKIYQLSGLSAEGFVNNILLQVRFDTSVTDDGNSYTRLNLYARSFTGDLSKVLAQLDTLERAGSTTVDVAELRALLGSPQGIFSSWKTFERFSILSRILEKADLLSQLDELRGKNDALRRYLEVLILHQDSRVSLPRVMELWQNPREFFGGEPGDNDQGEGRKKPSHYLDVPHLGLTAEQLRDALVDGTIDRIQVFTPLQIRYEIPTITFGGKIIMAPTYQELIIRMFGSRQQGLPGLVQDRRYIADLNAFLKRRSTDLQTYLYDPDSLSDDLHAEVQEFIARLFEQPFNFVTRRFIATLNLKSDPLAAVAGDDTVTCMPFGSLKTSNYMCNANTAFFTVQMEQQGRGPRTLAQSVLTKNRDVESPIPALVTRLAIGTFTPTTDDFTYRMTRPIITADNVEVAPNYTDPSNIELLEVLYRDFFSTYMDVAGAAEGLHTSKVVIGMGYSDALTNLPKAPNTYLPQAPVGYSDNFGPEVHVLDLKDGRSFMRRRVNVLQRDTYMMPDIPVGEGIKPLTFQDSLEVGLLEAEAYAGNDAMVEGPAAMENGLIAVAIKEARDDLPHLSVKAVDSDGKMTGYLFAYEGRDELEAGKGEERIVYVADIVSRQKDNLGGIRLLQGLLSLYTNSYTEPPYPPIVAEMRESTSYKIVTSGIFKRLARRAGFDVKVQEGSSEQRGSDRMHRVVFRISRA